MRPALLAALLATLGAGPAVALRGDRAAAFPAAGARFAGAVREPAADLAWSGPGGAAGRVRLTLVSPRSMRVEWSADKVGEEMGLGSGVATLVRRGPR